MRRLVPYVGKNGPGGCRDIREPLLEMFASYQAAGIDLEHAHEARMTVAELRRIRAREPDDTRDLTGRFFGDPLPGRSALDSRA
jgi:hypothetical protein